LRHVRPSVKCGDLTERAELEQHPRGRVFLGHLLVADEYLDVLGAKVVEAGKGEWERATDATR
jgi:hypothetical protein